MYLDSRPKSRVVAKNIIRMHGKLAFRKLIELFDTGLSGEKIGELFGVTRQRVCQWKKLLGTAKVSYRVHPDIVDLVSRPTRTSV